MKLSWSSIELASPFRRESVAPSNPPPGDGAERAMIPVLCGMFLEITSPVLALMIVATVLHDMTALWDVSYAVKRGKVTPIEQHIHSFLETVPVMAFSPVSILH